MPRSFSDGFETGFHAFRSDTGGQAGTGRSEGGIQQKDEDMAETMQDAFNEKVMDPARKAGEAMRDAGSKISETGSTVSLKMLDQAETNTREAFNAMRAAAGAKDLSEVMKIQGDFIREQSTRNMTQAREIGELIMQFGRDTVGVMRGDKG